MSAAVTGAPYIAYALGGAGSSTAFGGGGPAGMAAGQLTAGVDAFGYGGGGGGGGALIGTTSGSGVGKSGGAGAPGVLFVEW